MGPKYAPAKDASDGERRKSDAARATSKCPPAWAAFVDTLVDFACCGYITKAHNANILQSPSPPATLPAVPRLVAIGDLHGDLAKARAALSLAGLIDAKDCWSGGSTTLVQVGDILDRGPDEVKLFYLLERLQHQAAAAGGAVHILNGNHETMSAGGRFNYADPRAYPSFDTWMRWQRVGDALKGLCSEGSVPRALQGVLAANPWAPAGTHPSSPVAAEPLPEGIPEAGRARFNAIRPGGAFARRFLAPHPTVLQIGSSVFVHGGLLPSHVADPGLERINQEVARWLRGPDVLADATPSGDGARSGLERSGASTNASKRGAGDGGAGSGFTGGEGGSGVSKTGSLPESRAAVVEGSSGRERMGDVAVASGHVSDHGGAAYETVAPNAGHVNGSSGFSGENAGVAGTGDRSISQGVGSQQSKKLELVGAAGTMGHAGNRNGTREWGPGGGGVATVSTLAVATPVASTDVPAGGSTARAGNASREGGTAHAAGAGVAVGDRAADAGAVNGGQVAPGGGDVKGHGGTNGAGKASHDGGVASSDQVASSNAGVVASHGGVASSHGGVKRGAVASPEAGVASSNGAGGDGSTAMAQAEAIARTQAAAHAAWRRRYGPEYLHGRNAVVWLRKFSHTDGAKCDCETLKMTLERIPGAERMVVGHTIQYHQGVNSACGGRVIRVDVGLSALCGDRPPQVLEIINDRRLRVLGEDGSKEVPPADVPSLGADSRAGG